jgi:DNA adenine methylase
MKPLFMWAGGKSKMLKHYAPYLPTDFDTYIEPFFGGGAMYVWAYNKNPNATFVINDVNENIVQIYLAIKNNHSQFVSRMDELSAKYLSLNKQDRKTFYYELRNEYAFDYHKWDKTTESATLYFLMKTGFNGIWQINKNTNNRFGTPSGLLNEKDSVYDRENVVLWNKALQNTTILCSDFSNTLPYVTKDSWIFMDPPYRGGFTKYATEFDDDKQKQVVDFANSAVMLGAKAWVTNRDLEDSFFEQYLADNSYNMDIHKFDVTYTAGRRKKTQNGFEAKKAKEVLIISK